MAPAPRTRVPKGEVVTDPQDNIGDAEETLMDIDEETSKPKHDAVEKLASGDQPGQRKKSNGTDIASSPKLSSLLRRASANQNDPNAKSKRVDNPEVLEHLKHLGPSNLASKPRTTRYSSVKIKPGGITFADATAKDTPNGARSIVISPSSKAVAGGVGEGLVGSAGKDAKDGVHFLQVGYGSMDRPQSSKPQSPETSNKGVQVKVDSESSSPKPQRSRSGSNRSVSTIGSLQNHPPVRTRTARSGSITENIIESGGIRKVVLDVSSSSEEGQGGSNSPKNDTANNKSETSGQNGKGKSDKKKRRKKRKQGQSNDESTPLLNRD